MPVPKVYTIPALKRLPAYLASSAFCTAKGKEASPAPDSRRRFIWMP